MHVSTGDDQTEVEVLLHDIHRLNKIANERNVKIARLQIANTELEIIIGDLRRYVLSLERRLNGDGDSV